MAKFIATLTGNIDAHVERREFEQFRDATAWCEGEGLREFSDQPATGEVVCDGKSVWRKSQLGAAQLAERDMSRAVRRTILNVRYPRPLKRRR